VSKRTTLMDLLYIQELNKEEGVEKGFVEG
jgi:hypothetical protein